MQVLGKESSWWREQPHAKVLGWKHAWCVQGTANGTVWLKGD